jgi:hypothetical protein
MDLKDTVGFFSTEVFTDAFTPSTTFKGRMNPFAEATRSGSSSQRRILEVAPTVSIPPARIIISPSNLVFIVGASNHDYWNGEVIRHKFSTLPVEGQGSVGTIGEVLSDSYSDTTSYGVPYFARREPDAEGMSDFLSGYEVYLSQVKTFPRGHVIFLGGEYYRLRTDTFIDGAGFTVGQCIKLESPVQTFDINSERETYDEVSDSYNSIDVLGVTCFVEPLDKSYEFVTESFVKIEAGDKAISVLKSSATLGVNDLIGEYQVVAVGDHGTWVTCQCRRIP